MKYRKGFGERLGTMTRMFGIPVSLGVFLMAVFAGAGKNGVTDPTLVLSVPPLERPAAGEYYTDPVFGTRIRRVSDTSESGGWEGQIYSQLQAFSADNQYLLTTGTGPSEYQVRRVDDLSVVPGLNLAEINVPR